MTPYKKKNCVSLLSNKKKFCRVKEIEFCTTNEFSCATNRNVWQLICFFLCHSMTSTSFLPVVDVDKTIVSEKCENDVVFFRRFLCNYLELYSSSSRWGAEWISHDHFHFRLFFILKIADSFKSDDRLKD